MIQILYTVQEQQTHTSADYKIACANPTKEELLLADRLQSAFKSVLQAPMPGVAKIEIMEIDNPSEEDVKRVHRFRQTGH